MLHTHFMLIEFPVISELLVGKRERTVPTGWFEKVSHSTSGLFLWFIFKDQRGIIRFLKIKQNPVQIWPFHYTIYENDQQDATV